MSQSPVRELTLADLVRARVRNDPDQVALVVDGRARLTLGEWERRSRSVAHSLHERGVRRGDRIALLADDAGWIEYAIGTLAVYLSGATALGLTSRLPAPEIARRLADCGVTGVIHTAAAPLPPFAGWCVPLSSLELGGDHPPDVEILATDIAEILYTSGTTGSPKPVAVPHDNLTYGRDTTGELFGGIDSILCAVPVATNAGHSALMVALTTGSAAHVLTRVAPEEIVHLIERLKIQQAILTPAIALRLLSSGLLERDDLSGLSTLMIGSSSVPAAALSRLSQALPGAQIMIGYGSTESAPAFSRRSIPAWNDHGLDHGPAPGLASLGRPGGGSEVKIAGAQGEALPVGQTGEICLRSPAPGRAYFNQPAAQARTFTDGWVRMGDVGHVDEHGELYFFDRASDVIVSHGRSVSSVRIEGTLLWHPAVIDAAVFAVPDAAAGHLIVAAVELSRPTEVEELQAFARESLPGEDCPARIVVVDSLPRGPAGKVLKRELRQQFSR